MAIRTNSPFGWRREGIPRFANLEAFRARQVTGGTWARWQGLSAEGVSGSGGNWQQLINSYLLWKEQMLLSWEFFPLKTWMLGQVLGLAIETWTKMPSSLVKVLGLNSQLRLPTHLPANTDRGRQWWGSCGWVPATQGGDGHWVHNSQHQGPCPWPLCAFGEWTSTWQYLVYPSVSVYQILK